MVASAPGGAMENYGGVLDAFQGKDRSRETVWLNGIARNGLMVTHHGATLPWPEAS